MRVGSLCPNDGNWLLDTIRHDLDEDRQSNDTIAGSASFAPEPSMLLASLALLASQPATVTVHAAHVPCNPDAMKSIACNAQRHTPSPRRVAPAPIHCNPDPLKGAACHASAEQARADTRGNAARGDELAAAN